MSIPPEEVAKIFGLIETPELEPRYNVAPTQKVGVIRCGDDTGHNRLDILKWGFVPGWSKDLSFGSHLINARSETVAEKPAFRHAIKFRLTGLYRTGLIKPTTLTLSILTH